MGWFFVVIILIYDNLRNELFESWNRNESWADLHFGFLSNCNKSLSHLRSLLVFVKNDLRFSLLSKLWPKYFLLACNFFHLHLLKCVIEIRFYKKGFIFQTIQSNICQIVLDWLLMFDWIGLDCKLCNPIYIGLDADWLNIIVLIYLSLKRIM